MKCPLCGSTDTHVVDSRVARQGFQIRRRRECDKCEERFTTFESVEQVTPYVRKANSSETDPFDREKVKRSLLTALKKRNMDQKVLSEFLFHLETRIAQGPGRIVDSRVIGDTVLAFLKDQDPVAYVRYASVYRSFDNVEQFMTELLQLQSSPALNETKASVTETYYDQLQGLASGKDDA